MLPIGVTTFELTFGQTFDYEGVSLQTDLIVVPSHEVRTAAGERIVPSMIETSSPAGEYGSIDLPQPGQGNLYDLKGNLITNWWYTVTAVDSKAGRTVGDMKVWKLQPTIDQMVVDLDTQPTDQVVGPVGSVAPPAVTSVNGGTGAVTVEGVTDAALTAIAADTGSDFYAQQSATYAAVPKYDRDRFGSNFTYGNAGSFPTTEAGANVIADTKLGGPRQLLLCFHLGFDSGTLKIGQFGWTGNTASEANYDAVLAQLLSDGYTIQGIKVHNPGNPPGGFTGGFWTNYAALIDQLAAKFEGIAPWFFITNEYELATGNAANTSYLNGIIASVQARGYLAGMTFVGIGEASQCLVSNNLDLIGMNVYPSVSSGGVSTTRAQVHAALRGHGFIEYFRDMKRANPDLVTVVTEIGTTDTAISLEYTPQWDVGGLPDTDGVVSGIYWDGILTLAIAESIADYIFAWDEHLFSPWIQPTSLAVMHKYIESEA